MKTDLCQIAKGTKVRQIVNYPLHWIISTLLLQKMIKFCLLVWLQKKDQRKVWLKIWRRPVNITWWRGLCRLTVCFLIECVLWKWKWKVKVWKTLPSHCLLSDRMSAVKVEPWLKIHFTKSQNPHPWISSSVSSLKAKGLRFSRGFSSVQRNPLTERFISSTIHSCISIGNCCYIHICIFPPNQ